MKKLLFLSIIFVCIKADIPSERMAASHVEDQQRRARETCEQQCYQNHQNSREFSDCLQSCLP